MRTTRTLCASTLIGEVLVIGLAGLVATRLSELPAGTVWTVSGLGMALCVLLTGALGRPGAVPAGWVLQLGLVLSGFAVPIMFFLGLVFAGLWWASVHYGRQIDQAKAHFAAATESAPETATEPAAEERVEPAVEEATEEAPGTAAEAVAEPETETATQPATGPATDSVTESERG